MSLLSNETCPNRCHHTWKISSNDKYQVNIDDDLVHSIRKNGLISPIVLKKTSDI